MRQLRLSFCLAFGLSWIASAYAQTPSEVLKKAEVWTFYSASTLHSKYECKQALDSVSAWNDAVSESDSLSKALLSRMQLELELGQDNSGDNMNGIFPAFGFMTQQRSDYHVLDDAGEALAEDLVSQFLSMPSNVRKGLNGQNGLFAIVSSDDNNLGVVNILMDLINSESSLYAIRPNELVGLVPCNMEDGGCLQEMSPEHWEAVLDKCNSDEVLLLTLQSKQEISEEISYTGLLVQSFGRGGERLEFQTYLEGFRTDKIAARMDAIWLVVIGLLIAFLVMTAIGVLGYSEGKFLIVDDWKTMLHAKKNVFAIAVSMVTVYAAFWGGVQVAPALNEYSQSPEAILWILGMVVLPPLAAVLVTYVLMWRTMKDWAVNEMSNFSRMIQAAFLATYVMMGYWNFISHPAPRLSHSILELGLASVFTISPAWVMGQVLHQVLGASARPARILLSSLVALFSWVLICWSMVFSFADEYTASDFLHIAGFVIAVIYLGVLPKIEMWLRSEDNQGETSSYELNNPKTIVTEGLNWSRAKSALNSWMETADISVFVLQGVVGSGKSRFLREWMSETSNHLDQSGHAHLVLMGDFGQSHDQNVSDFEPFVEAIRSSSETKSEEWSRIFRDNSQMADTIAGSVFTAGELLGIPVPEQTVDENRGIADVVSSLISKCETFRKSRGKDVVIIFDNYSWASSDEKSRQLLLELIDRLNRMPIHKRPLKFVLAMEESSTDSGNEQLLDELKKDGDNPVEVWPEFLGWDATLSGGVAAGISSWLRSLSAELEWFDDGSTLRISRKLLQHLEGKVERALAPFDELNRQTKGPSPGDVLRYVHTLQQEGFVQIQGQVIELVNDPYSSGIPLIQGELVEKTKKFEALPEDSKRLLVSAAHVGFKFDAELLSEVWKLDLLQVLNILDHADVEGVFVRDQSSEDNVYSFMNRDVHLKVKQGFASSADSSRVRQIVVEFQKRVLNHLYQRDISFLMRVDLEVLNATANDCIQYIDVDAIRQKASTTLLVAAYRNLKEGNVTASEAYLQRWTDIVLVKRMVALEPSQDGESGDVYWLTLILSHLNESDRSLRLALGASLTNADGMPIRERLRAILSQIHFRGGAGAGNACLQLLEESRLVLDALQKKSGEATDIAEWREWQAYILAKWSFEDEVLNLDRDFSIGCGEGNVKEIERVAETLLKRNDAEASNLRGRAFRKLAAWKGYERGQEFLMRAIEHQLSIMHLRDSDEPLDPAEVLSHMQVLQDIFGRQRHPEGNNHCFLLGALTQHVRSDAQRQVQLGDWMIEAGERQGVKFTRNWGYSLKAEGLISLGNFQESEETYENYGDALLSEGAPGSEFQFVLAGLLKLGKVQGSFASYFKLKEKMYESLRIISSSLKDEVAELFGDALPEGKMAMDNSDAGDVEFADERENEMVRNMLQVLARMALADGVLDDHEIHDLGETALACCIHLGVQSKSNVLHEMNAWLEEWRMRLDENREAFMEENVEEFARTSREINRICTPGEKRQILRLCYIIAKADGVIDENEQQLLDVANDNIST